MNAITKLELSRLKTPSLEHNKPTILVLGGYGFIGRHIVEELKRLGTRVLIGTRNKKSLLKPAGERSITLHKLKGDPRWQSQLDGVDVVINTVGILRQRWNETYDSVHHQAVSELANACAERNIRFIHISALGLNNPLQSRFLKSKLRGEQALVKSAADWHLVRPSLVDGHGGYGAKWFRRVAQWPLYFVPNNARGIIAPIDANELAKAVTIIALSKNEISKEKRINRIYELGGRKNMSLTQYLDALRPQKPTIATKCIKIPGLLARAVSHICDLLYLTPFSFGHYELLQYDNMPKHNRLDELLNKWNRYRRLNKPGVFAI